VAGAIEDGSFTTEQAGLLDSALTGAGVEHTVEFYPAHHGFAVPDNPNQIVRTLTDALAPGSYLAISDVARDLEADANVVESADRLNKRLEPAQQTIRSPEEIAAFFSGLDMVEPGLAQLPRWRPDLGYIGPAGGITLSAYCGVGRKPRGGS